MKNTISVNSSFPAAGSTRSLRCGDDLLGSITLDGASSGAYVGLLIPGPDFERYRSLFDRVFELQRRVDQVADADYLAAWDDWRQSLAAIERLGLTFGAEDIPVEGFEVDDLWQVRFQAALWWVAMSGGLSVTQPTATTDPGDD